MSKKVFFRGKIENYQYHLEKVQQLRFVKSESHVLNPNISNLALKRQQRALFEDVISFTQKCVYNTSNPLSHKKYPNDDFYTPLVEKHHDG